jgi:hypothetical protein
MFTATLAAFFVLDDTSQDITQKEYNTYSYTEAQRNMYRHDSVFMLVKGPVQNGVNVGSRRGGGGGDRKLRKYGPHVRA